MGVRLPCGSLIFLACSAKQRLQHDKESGARFSVLNDLDAGLVARFFVFFVVLKRMVLLI
jgi:hypothetical protein